MKVCAQHAYMVAVTEQERIYYYKMKEKVKVRYYLHYLNDLWFIIFRHKALHFTSFFYNIFSLLWGLFGFSFFSLFLALKVFSFSFTVACSMFIINSTKKDKTLWSLSRCWLLNKNDQESLYSNAKKKLKLFSNFSSIPLLRASQ